MRGDGGPAISEVAASAGPTPSKGITTMTSDSTRHTPGPWGYGYDSFNARFEVRDADARMTIIVKPRGNREYAEVEANARLIAAAPEMEKLLRWALDGCEWCSFRNAEESPTDPKLCGRDSHDEMAALLSSLDQEKP